MPTLNEVLNELAQTFQTTVSEVQLEGYQVALGDCTEEELTRAAGTWIRSERWMPRPADLRGLVVLDRSQRLRERRIHEARETYAAAGKLKPGPLRVPEGLRLCQYMQQLKAEGMTSAEIAGERICG